MPRSADFMFQSSPLIAEGRYLRQREYKLYRNKFQSSPLIAEGRYGHLRKVTNIKCFEPLFHERVFLLLEQSIAAPNTSINSLIFFIRESPCIFAIAPGPR
jgi:hypothetical protein